MDEQNVFWNACIPDHERLSKGNTQIFIACVDALASVSHQHDVFTDAQSVHPVYVFKG